ncbi:MAG: hypothetical protein QM698_06775 [Micropepsaceae bacterium]
MRRFAIAGLQLELTRQDNLQRLAEEVRLLKARLPWVQMVVLGELSAYGPGLDSAQPQGGAAETAFRDMARRHKNLADPRLVLRERRRSHLQRHAGHQSGRRGDRPLPQDVSLPAV